MKAIILAGESQQDIEAFGKGKALIPFNDIPLIQYSIDALTGLGSIDYILVIGNKDALTPLIGTKVDKIIDGENDLLNNLMKSISYFQNEESIIIATCDIPLITPEAIEWVVTKTRSLKADICYPIIEKVVYEKKYPDAKRTYASLKDGEFTGGNLVIVNPNKIKAMEKEIRLLIQHRKNPIKMTKVLGPTIVFKLLSKQLTVKYLEYYIKERFNIEGKALVTPYPEVGTDVDHIEDIKILEKYI